MDKIKEIYGMNRVRIFFKIPRSLSAYGDYG
jgi:hypothetical protein